MAVTDDGSLLRTVFVPSAHRDRLAYRQHGMLSVIKHRNHGHT